MTGLGGSSVGRVEVDLPSGRTLTTELRTTGAPSTVVERAPEPGIYRFHADGRTVALGAANVDPLESDLAPAVRSEVEEFLSPLPSTFIEPGARLGEEVLQARYGRELWRAFLYVALALLAVEMFLARPRFG
jgi:hypothetical protein